MPRYQLTIDGADRVLDADADTPLLYALRELGLRGPKFGCGLAQCGACTVLIDGEPARACVLPLSAIASQPIRTLDGLSADAEPHPVQQAFIDEEAAQCGYCTNGWIMTAVAALERDPARTDADIRALLAGLKCRCGTHMSILRAVRLAADRMADRTANSSSTTIDSEAADG